MEDAPVRHGHVVAHHEESYRQPLIGPTAESLRAERSNLCPTQRLLRRLRLLLRNKTCFVPGSAWDDSAYGALPRIRTQAEPGYEESDGRAPLLACPEVRVVRMTPALPINQMYCDGTAERGAALVTVLLAITLLTIVVVEFAYSTQIDHHLAYNSLRSLQATYVARSGVNLALLVLQKDGQDSGLDALNEDWARVLPPLPVGEGAVTIRVTDEQGKLNLNVLRNNNGTINMQWRQVAERLFMARGLEPSLLDPLLDWLDVDDFPEPRGAEKNYYLNLSPPYIARNGALFTLGELGRVAGFTAAIQARLADVVSVLPNNATKINENTAPREVLAALFPSVTPDALEAFVASRMTTPSHGRNDLRERLGLSPQAQEEGLNLTNPRSEFFSVVTLAAVGETRQLFRAIVQRRAGETILLSWQSLIGPPSDEGEIEGG